MIKIATQLRNAAKFGSPVAPGEREKAADTIEKLAEALRTLMDDTRATYDACKAGAPEISIGQFRRVNDALLLLVELGESNG